jgi:hypothetical protein
MNWNDYEAVWKRQELPVGFAADVTSLRESFDAKSRKMAGALFARDLLESGIGLMLCVGLLFLWWTSGRAGWPYGLSALLIFVVSGRFIRERLRARKAKVRADASLLAKVEADIVELRHQRHLLKTARTWFLAPVFAVYMAVSAQMTLHSQSWALARNPYFRAAHLSIYLLLVLLASWINRRAVRTEVDPRIAELEKLKADLTA